MCTEVTNQHLTAFNAGSVVNLWRLRLEVSVAGPALMEDGQTFEKMQLVS